MQVETGTGDAAVLSSSRRLVSAGTMTFQFGLHNEE
jgi:hypothetical protein